MQYIKVNNWLHHCYGAGKCNAFLSSGAMIIAVLIIWKWILGYVDFPVICLLFIENLYTIRSIINSHKFELLIQALCAAFLFFLPSYICIYFIYFFIQQVLISYLFYTYQCIHVNPNLPIQHTTPTPLSLLGVHTFVLYICVSISALQTSSSVPFFQITHICVNIQYLFFSF